MPSLLGAHEQAQILQYIYSSSKYWRNDLDRRVQHYGWRYDYRARKITYDMKLGCLPDWLDGLANRLYHETKLFHRLPEQVIVNEYRPGQGIAMHVDHRSFGPVIATVSLGDDWEMDFRRDQYMSCHVMLERGSALILSKDARSHWMHGIAKRIGEQSGTRRRRRQRRVSLTFRTVNKSQI